MIASVLRGREKITLEDDIELFILKNGIVTYAEIVSRIKVSDEYITQAVKNLMIDGKIIRCKGEAYKAYA
jgi:predicted transcriptional regulator